ncbi:AraC family transcriptional regulator [Winslowiella iniecta]|uniref:Transcriptional regulator n=1 Tax=Winslowiella iniecta TaxID=1560201 RepID=A0A0L7SYJ0_9GAMM|nr:AraC family transcriptional regulator [Winslowiella iniecta]KOC88187.1 transcriptional regulator [Winslowiella iniecta]KOC94211.1 transcriptional regulator [Winslowiella iniecta]
MSLQSSEWFSHKGIECSRVKAANDAFPRHLHDEYVISANLSGSEEIWLDGKTASVSAGQVTVYNPTSVQASKFGGDSVEFVSIHLSQSLLSSIASQQNLRSSNAAPILYDGVLNNPELHQAICRFALTARHGDPQWQQQDLIVLCGELLDPHSEHDKADQPAINAVKAWMHDSLTVKPQLDMLAQVSGLSKYHLVRRFSQQVGMPPLQYHMQLRLHRARDMLRKNVAPLEVAMLLGFYDQSHFINAFRKVMGTTPQHYARQCRFSAE